MSKEAMKQALEALIGAIEAARTDVTHYAALDFDMCEDALQKGYAALEALAKQEQGEPVAHFGSAYVNENGVHITTVLGPVAIPQNAKLYTTPQQREPLTDKMIFVAARVMNDRQADACNVDRDDQWKIYGQDFIDDARAMMEAAHGIKE